MRLQAGTRRNLYGAMMYDVGRVKQEPPECITVDDADPKLVLSEDEENVSGNSENKAYA